MSKSEAKSFTFTVHADSPKVAKFKSGAEQEYLPVESLPSVIFVNGEEYELNVYQGRVRYTRWLTSGKPKPKGTAPKDI
jgi:hypothetical protein